MKYPKLGSVITIPNRQGEFVVEYANWEGGGTGMGPHDVYPDGLHIKARKLSKGRKYNRKNRSIKFVWGPSCYNTQIVGCEVVGKMEVVFQKVNFI